MRKKRHEERLKINIAFMHCIQENRMSHSIYVVCVNEVSKFEQINDIEHKMKNMK